MRLTSMSGDVKVLQSSSLPISKRKKTKITRNSLYFSLAKETRAYWVIGKQIEINKEIEEKFRVVDKESIKLNEKLLQFMNQLKDKRKSTNAMKTNLLEAQYQNLDIFESKVK